MTTATPAPASVPPRGSRVSTELTEIRTVHTRAATALASLDRHVVNVERAKRPEAPDWEKTFYGSLDPDHDAIRSILETVVTLTAPFARTTRKKAT